MAAHLISGVGFSFLTSGVGWKLLSEKKLDNGPSVTFLKASMVGSSIFMATFLPHYLAKYPCYRRLRLREDFDEGNKYFEKKYLILSAAGILAIPLFANLTKAQGIAMAVLGIAGGIFGVRVSLIK